MKAKALDQFYTKPEVARACIAHVPQKYRQGYTWLEPASGSGSFFNNFPTEDKVAVDIDPKIPEALQSDFFEYTPTQGENVITVTNPPFGKFSKLAVEFFNHAATFSKAICVLVPCSFEEHRIQRRLDKRFKLTFQQRVRHNAFSFEGKDYPLRCVFQVWEIDADIDLRCTSKVKYDTHEDFTLVAEPSKKRELRPTAHKEMDYDFAVPWWDCKRKTLSREEMQSKDTCTSYWLIKTNSPQFVEKVENADLVSWSAAGQKTAPAIRWNDFIKAYDGLKAILI